MKMPRRIATSMVAASLATSLAVAPAQAQSLSHHRSHHPLALSRELHQKDLSLNRKNHCFLSSGIDLFAVQRATCSYITSSAKISSMVSRRTINVVFPPFTLTTAGRVNML